MVKPKPESPVAQLAPALRILRIRQSLNKTGDSRSSFYSKMAKGLYPSPIKLSARAAGWVEHELEAVLRLRVAGGDEAQIRKLVKSLEEARCHVG